MLIYKATNKTNNKSYIGLTNNTLLERQWQHHSDARSGSTFPFHRALRIHTDLESWDWEILAECKTEEEASNLEIQYVAKYNTFKSGYNATSGGLREYTTKRTIKEIDNLIELDILIVDAPLRGHPGKPKSKEHLSKISESKLAYFQTTEGIAARRRRSEKMNAFWASPEGQKRKEEQRKKCGRKQDTRLSESEILSVKDRFAIGETVSSLARKFNVSRASIYRYIKKS